MSAQLEKLDGLRRKLSVTVPADQIEAAYLKRANDFAKNAKIKGFRPGKIPLSVVEQKFGHGLLQETAAHLVETSLQATLMDQKIRMAGMPQVDFSHETLKRSDAFTYEATFEVYPEIVLKDLANIDVESPSAELTDEDVSGMLVQLRTQHSEWSSVDRTAKLGDRVKINFDGVMDGQPMENGSAKNHSLELGSKSMIPGFEDGIIGMKKGDIKVIDIAFPAEYHVESLRSKPVTFTITLHEIEEPSLPALDDDFAKKLGVKEGLDTLKKNVRDRMDAELKENTRTVLKKNVLDKLLAENPVEVPDALIDQEVSHLQEMTRQQMRQYLGKDAKIDVSKFPLSREPYVENAKRRVVLGLLLAEVIKQNDIKVDQNHVKEKLTEMAKQYGSVEQILPLLLQNKQMVSDVEAFVLEEQAIDLLLKSARVTDVKKSYDAIMNAVKENPAL